MSSRLVEAARMFGGLIEFENGETAVDQMFRKGFDASASMGLSADEHMSVDLAVQAERARSAKLAGFLKALMLLQSPQAMQTEFWVEVSYELDGQP